ncbi:hypothetical protein CYMTET_41574 [Cymbomonas tetramitiformis]|uniref:Uncharacterized protein n=1 Tax=Cymbomonas tetramitiformis TaxID=36881 RepID=A0AAE0C797_9CHLO|nr:hypothetical protein CYMTET_41574 [Cymbomonas tetramitiformis]
MRRFKSWKLFPYPVLLAACCMIVLFLLQRLHHTLSAELQALVHSFPTAASDRQHHRILLQSTTALSAHSTWITCINTPSACTQIDLASSSLTGTIPTEIGTLTVLTELIMGSNCLTGSVPTQLSQLTALTNMGLATNMLTGIPTELGALTALVQINMGYNSLSQFPTEIGALTMMTRLLWSHSSIFGSMPTVLGLLSRMNAM